MYNYEEFLTRKLNIIKTELGYEDLTLEIATEQAFSKKKNLLPNTVYIVIKYLTADISYGAIAQPVQILCLSEQNSLEKTRLIFTKFAEDNNFLAEITNGVFTKHQYTTPVVLSNYEEVGYGYRSVLYMTATLNILENVLDVKNLTIDGESVSQLAFNLSYQMTPNTQQKASETIASSAKSTACLSLGLTIPFLSNALSAKIINIMGGNGSGNEDFIIKFDIGGTPFSEFSYKLTNANIITSPGSVPALQIGLIR